MDDNFSPRVKDVIAYSKEEALRLGHDFIGTEHLMLGLLRDGNGKAISILDAMDVDLDHLRRKVEILSPPNPNATTQPKDKKNLHLTRQAERALAPRVQCDQRCPQRRAVLRLGTESRNRLIQHDRARRCGQAAQCRSPARQVAMRMMLQAMFGQAGSFADPAIAGPAAR